MTENIENEYGSRPFSNITQLQQMLEQKVPVDFVSTRPGPSNLKLTYLESWKAVELSNAIFGFDGWSCCITNLNVDYVDEERGKFKVGVTAVVRVTLKNGVYHEDVGVGMSEMPKKGMAIELAKKEAVSDARKRALRLFGNYLGNSLYDGNYVRRLDTNHKVVDLNPLTFNSIRSRNKEVFESQFGVDWESFGVNGKCGISMSEDTKDVNNENNINDIKEMKEMNQINSKVEKKKEDLAEDTFGDDIFDLL